MASPPLPDNVSELLALTNCGAMWLNGLQTWMVIDEYGDWQNVRFAAGYADFAAALVLLVKHRKPGVGKLLEIKQNKIY